MLLLFGVGLNCVSVMRFTLASIHSSRGSSTVRAAISSSVALRYITRGYSVYTYGTDTYSSPRYSCGAGRSFTPARENFLLPTRPWFGATQDSEEGFTAAAS